MVVPPDDYDHWAPKSDASADTTEETLDAPARRRSPTASGAGGKAKPRHGPWA
ncbi:hypothetical protein I550_1967 [Mycobacterium intracellulare 1956]|uniref:Uncharacterized protein n=1 Tax=Mycobacterium intracellulare 1956 TaxID=1299331 RepID=X8CS28_MYCIT|nr:hypothetical protein I550_1967 [Mycobacterium intracellulare 1956]